ncbi:MAG: AI-2E family transporter [Caldilineaceae bacterium]|nr:AI-2E family transporter [Caldilineaceae bacterium]
MPSRRWNNLTKIIITVALAIGAILLVVTFRALISPTIIAFLMAFVLGYPVNWIQRRTGLARAPAVVVLYVGLLLSLVIVTVLIIPRASTLATSLELTIEELATSLLRTEFQLGTLTLSFGSLLGPLSNAMQNAAGGLTADPLSMVRGVTASVLTVVYVMVVNFWLLKDLNKLQRMMLEQIPLDYQEDARHLGLQIVQVWEGFLRGQLVLALVVGVVTWIPLAIVGMANAGGLALLAGVMEFLPSIGPGISGTIGVLVALYQGSTWMNVSNVVFAIIVLAIYSVIAQVESIYFIPQLVGGRVKLHPAVAFVSVIGGALSFGALGVLLATPTVGSMRLILMYIYRKLLDQEPFEDTSRDSMVRIPGLIGGRKIEAIIFDLDGTLTALDWHATTWAAQPRSWLDWLMPTEHRREQMRRLMIALEGFINFVISQLQRRESTKQLERLLPFFNTLRGYPPPERLQLQPCVLATLHQLSVTYPVALISARDDHSLRQFAQTSELDLALFQAVATRDSVRNLLPHSEGLIWLAEQLAIAPEQILIVSDTDVNLRAGRAMGMASAGVLCGLGDEFDMRDADIIVPDVTELPAWL